MNEQWFNWYCQQIEKQKQWATYRDRYLCPCCFMPTLGERMAYEICEICGWEDDGQDTDDAEVVRGGPNRDYSLAEARANFSAHFTMYRPVDERPYALAIEVLAQKKRLYHAYETAMCTNEDADWELALCAEKRKGSGNS